MYPEHIQRADSHVQTIFPLLLVRHIPKCLLFTISIATITAFLDSARKMVSLLPPSHSSMQPESRNGYHIPNSLPGLTKTHRCHCFYLYDPSHPLLHSLFLITLQTHCLVHILLIYRVHYHFETFTNGSSCLEIWNASWPLLFVQMSV